MTGSYIVMQKRFLPITYIYRKLTHSDVCYQVHIAICYESMDSAFVARECDPTKKEENTSYPIDVVYTGYNGITPKLLLL